MDRLAERLSVATRTVATLGEVVGETKPPPTHRDAAIKRFEYSMEATWKAAQQYLRVVEGVDVGSPKGAGRACRRAGLLSDSDGERILAMVDDRNLATHTYNDKLAKALYKRLPGHFAVLERWLAAMEKGRGAAAR